MLLVNSVENEVLHPGYCWQTLQLSRISVYFLHYSPDAVAVVVHVSREEVFKCIIICIDLKVRKREDTRATSGG
jgi:hypothetical protein